MNIKLLLFISLISLLYILSVSSSNGRATTAGEGNTGAPGDNNKVCSTCHSGGIFNPTIDIRILDEDGNMIEKYLPSTSYKVEVQIDATEGSPIGYGFQLVSLKDADNSDVSEWSNPSSNAKVVSAMGRNYAEHAGVSATNVFSMDWLSPDEGTGIRYRYIKRYIDISSFDTDIRYFLSMTAIFDTDIDLFYLKVGRYFRYIGNIGFFYDISFNFANY